VGDARQWAGGGKGHAGDIHAQEAADQLMRQQLPKLLSVVSLVVRLVGNINMFAVVAGEPAEAAPAVGSTAVAAAAACHWRPRLHRGSRPGAKVLEG
jgi:hypothetical protein